MEDAVIKRTLVVDGIDGCRTSDQNPSDNDITPSKLMESIDEDCVEGTLSSAIRLFALEFLGREQARCHGQTAEAMDLRNERSVIAQNIERLRSLLPCASNDHEHKTVTDLIVAEGDKLAALPHPR